MQLIIVLFVVLLIFSCSYTQESKSNINELDKNNYKINTSQSIGIVSNN